MSRVKVVGVVLMVALVGVWAIRSFVIGGSEGAPVQSPTSSIPPVDAPNTDDGSSAEPASVVAAGELAGVPIGYPQSDRGAATAAVNWVASFPTVVRMGPLRLADSMTRLLSDERSASGSEEVVADYFELFDELGPEFASRVWIESPLQVTTSESTSETAEVAVWSMLVTGDQVDGPIEVLWRTHHVSLAWERSDWRIDDVTITEGPTPVPNDMALPSAPSDFDAVNGWEPAVFADTTSEVE